MKSRRIRISRKIEGVKLRKSSGRSMRKNKRVIK
jgi:hypothetical protein